MEYGLLIILLLPLIGGATAFYVGIYLEKLRDIINCITTLANLVFVSYLFQFVLKAPIDFYIKDIMGVGLDLKLDLFRYVFVWITAFIWFLTTLYSTQYIIKYQKRNRYYAFFMLTYVSTLGIFMSDNWLNLFTFFEIMSLASYALVIHDEDKYSHDAGVSYIGMALAGGLVMLMGLLLLYYYTGTLTISNFYSGIEYIGNIRYVIFLLIFTGFAVKASVVPLHSWCPKAYTAAPTPATAILSGILLKTGLFGIILLTWKLMNFDIYVSYMIIILGCVNILHGGILALMQRNIKRILAYSGISQAGYILLGIGLSGVLGKHGGIAIVGTLYHIFNHAMYKVLLFIGVGIIYVVLHEISINKIQGFGKNKIGLKFIFLLGFLAIIGMPGTNGFISKTILHEAIIEAKSNHLLGFFSLVEFIFTVGGGLTVSYLLKIFVTVFLKKNDEFHGQFINHIRKRALFPMAILGACIVFVGLRPEIVFDYLCRAVPTLGKSAPHTAIHFYSFHSIKGAIIPFVIGLIIYYSYVAKYYVLNDDGKQVFVNPSLSWVELETDVYRPLISLIFIFLSTLFKVVDRGIIFIFEMIKRVVFKLIRVELVIPNLELSQLSMDFLSNEKSGGEISSGKFIEWEKQAYFDSVEKSQTEIKTLREVFVTTGSHLNSLLYTVFTFVFVLVMVLMLMLRSS